VNYPFKPYLLKLHWTMTRSMTFSCQTKKSEQHPKQSSSCMTCWLFYIHCQTSPAVSLISPGLSTSMCDLCYWVRTFTTIHPDQFLSLQ